MRYTLTIRQAEFSALQAEIFGRDGAEGGAYLICGVSRTDGEYRFLVRSVVPVEQKHYRRRERTGLTITSESYVNVAKLAKTENAAIVFVHSHPDGYLDFSPQDDREEPKLHIFFNGRVPDSLHASIVVARSGKDDSLRGRVWVDGRWQPLSRVRILGDRFHFLESQMQEEDVPSYFDRQVRAFGKPIQRLLGRLHIGVVGVGGTGSAVVEQLARLGVGTISVFDKDVFDQSNVNRVYGSSTADEAAPKTGIAARNVAGMNLNCRVNRIQADITKREGAVKLRDCDIVFGCTDNESTRDVLVRLATWYLIPVFDLGVVVTPEGEGDTTRIRDVIGRVTTLLPGEACLHCRGRITPQGILAESLAPEELARQVAEGYLRGIQENAPAVIPFTSAVASQGVSELLHRLLGFMGVDRVSNEVLLFFNQTRTRTTRAVPDEDCFCNSERFRGRGDSRDLLGLPSLRTPLPS